MRQFIDAFRTANDILMNSPYNGAYLIVEGDRDYLLYGKFVDFKSCELIAVNGRPNVIDVIKLVNERSKNDNTLGIIDIDFDNILGDKIQVDNVIGSDFHDIEISMLLSPTFDTITNLHCQEEKIIKVIRINNTTVLQYLLELTLPISTLKLANKVFNLGLVFKPKNPEGELPDYGKCFNLDNMKFLGIEQLINLMINYSRNKSEKLASQSEILESYKKIENEKFDLLHISNGHDLIHLFQLCLRKVLGNYNRKQYTLKDIEQQIILGFDSSHFSETNVYSHIKIWETQKLKKVLKF